MFERVDEVGEGCKVVQVTAVTFPRLEPLGGGDRVANAMDLYGAR